MDHSLGRSRSSITWSPVRTTVHSGFRLPERAQALITVLAPSNLFSKQWQHLTTCDAAGTISENHIWLASGVARHCSKFRARQHSATAILLMTLLLAIMFCSQNLSF